MPAEVVTTADLEKIMARIEALEARLAQPRPKYVNGKQAAVIRGCSATTFWRMRKAGEVRQMPGPGRPRFHREYLEALAAGVSEGEAWRKYVRPELLIGKNRRYEI